MWRLTERLGAWEGPVDGELPLDWDTRRKTRHVTSLPDGRAVALHLERPAIGQGQHLRDGDVLGGQDVDGQPVRVRVRAANERLIEVRADDALALARCAYHLGNRHASVAILAEGGGTPILRTRDDVVMIPMLKGLGAEVAFVDAPFEPEVGAYAHHHDHEGHEGHGKAKIHRFVRMEPR